MSLNALAVLFAAVAGMLLCGGLLAGPRARFLTAIALGLFTVAGVLVLVAA